MTGASGTTLEGEPMSMRSVAETGRMPATVDDIGATTCCMCA